jgi:hypothetical protein
MDRVGALRLLLIGGLLAGSVGPWPYDCAKTTVNGLRAACTQPVVRLR